MLGQLFVHTLNVLLSNSVAHAGEENPCSLYFLNILVDTTLGVSIIYITLRITTHVLTDVLGFSGFVSGQYSDRNKRGRGKASRPKVSFWLKQLANYFFTLLLVRFMPLGNGVGSYSMLTFSAAPIMISASRCIQHNEGDRHNSFHLLPFPFHLRKVACRPFWRGEERTGFLRNVPVSPSNEHSAGQCSAIPFGQ